MNTTPPPDPPDHDDPTRSGATGPRPSVPARRGGKSRRGAVLASTVVGLGAFTLLAGNATDTTAGTAGSATPATVSSGTAGTTTPTTSATSDPSSVASPDTAVWDGESIDDGYFSASDGRSSQVSSARGGSPDAGTTNMSGAS